MQAKSYKPKVGNHKGFTIIEALVVLFVFSLITVVFYQVWATGTAQIINAKNRLGATALANEQMEIVRSLIFDDIGTKHWNGSSWVYGIPGGNLLQDEDTSANGTFYHIHRVAQFVDDPTDGTAGAGDSAPNDYKKVTITVSWGNKTASEQVEVASDFSLDGVESVAVGTGVLSINILNNAGDKVSGASVHITNATVSPAVDFTDNTDASGNLSYPGAPESMQGYHVAVSKAGYYGVVTYPPYPTSTYNPINTHISVVAGSLTPATLVMDRVSTIEFRTVDPFGTEIPNINFSISGGLVLGTNPVDGTLVYDYSQATSTGGSGEKNLSDRSSGLYTVKLGAGETGYQYLRLTPEENTFGTISLLPGTTSTVHMVLASKTFSSALIIAKNNVDSSPIAGASVHLTNSGLSYDETVATDTYGQAYFPTTAVPLAAGTYDVEITASGFTTKTGTITINGTALDTKDFSLNAS